MWRTLLLALLGSTVGAIQVAAAGSFVEGVMQSRCGHGDLQACQQAQAMRQERRQAEWNDDLQRKLDRHLRDVQRAHPQVRTCEAYPDGRGSWTVRCW